MFVVLGKTDFVTKFRLKTSDKNDANTQTKKELKDSSKTSELRHSTLRVRGHRKREREAHFPPRGDTTPGCLHATVSARFETQFKSNSLHLR